MPPTILHSLSTSAIPAQQLGPYRVETLIAPHEEIGMSCYRILVAPNQTTATSYHLVAEEIYYILFGSGEAFLDDKPYPLAAGDFLRLPPATRHAFRAGSEGLLMLDIHSPSSRPDKDVYFEGTPPEGFGASHDSSITSE